MSTHLGSIVFEPLVEVGRVVSPWQTPEAVPINGGPSLIEIYPQYKEALIGIEKASHLVVIAYMHCADRGLLVSRARKHAVVSEERGVFATRSPSRPNPLSLTVVELVARNRLVLSVSPLDLLDGTPVVDVKAYVPGWDSVFSAKVQHRVPSFMLPDSVLKIILQQDLRNHLGRIAETDTAQSVLRAVIRAVGATQTEPRDAAMRFEVSCCDVVVDAIIALSGATFSSGRIAVLPDVGSRCLRIIVRDYRHSEVLK